MAVVKISELSEVVGSGLAPEADLMEIVNGGASRKIKVATLLGPTPPTVTGTSYTLALADAFRSVVFDSASAQTITIPTNAAIAYPIGTRVRGFRKGTGSVKFVPDTGVTLRLPTAIQPKRFMGAKAVHAGATGVNWSSDTSVPFAGSDEYDTDAFHDPVTNNTRITIPSNLGIRKVRLFGTAFANNFSSGWCVTYFSKDGSTNFGFNNFSSTVGSLQMSNASDPIACVDGTYFQFVARVQTDTSIDPTASTTFALEVTEIDAQGYIAYQYGSIEIQKVDTDEWIVTDQSALG